MKKLPCAFVFSCILTSSLFGNKGTKLSQDYIDKYPLQWIIQQKEDPQLSVELLNNLKQQDNNTIRHYVTVKDPSGKSALHYAASDTKNAFFIEELLSMGADKFSLDDNECYPYEYAPLGSKNRSLLDLSKLDSFQQDFDDWLNEKASQPFRPLVRLMHQAFKFFSR